MRTNVVNGVGLMHEHAEESAGPAAYADKHGGGFVACLFVFVPVASHVETVTVVIPEVVFSADVVWLIVCVLVTVMVSALVTVLLHH